MFLKGPKEALTPSQGGRGRSRILHGDHERRHRTKSPSLKELKRRISRPMAYPSPVDMLPKSSPVEMLSARVEPLFVHKKRSNSPHIMVRRLQESEMPAAVPEEFPGNDGLLDRGRSVSYNDNSRPVRISHRRGFSENYSKRRSTSLGRAREPSPLRNVIFSSEQTQAVNSLQIPTGIPEMDGEDIVSPCKLPSELNLALVLRPHSEPSTPKVEVPRDHVRPSTPPRYNKELPVLPSYLMPRPLFVRSESSDMEAALQALHERYDQHAEFVSWNVELDVPLPESPDSATGSDSHSPTFSSIRGDASGVSTPQRLSQLPDWPLGRPLTGSSMDLDLSHDVDSLSIHARTASNASTAVPYILPVGFGSNPFSEHRMEGQDTGPRKMTQMEQLLDEFDYLGAALI
jgi:hypothetical protein